MLHEFVGWIAELVGQWGYPGIVVLMALESSLFPLPSEIVIPPAAYLAANSEMNFGLVVLSGTVGSIIGAACNYWLAMYLGRPFLVKYGKYLLVSSNALARSEQFFAQYGHISTFIGRLLPGIRHCISLPAGLARMNFPLFCAATGLGAGIWVLILACMGYWFGKNQELMMNNLHYGTLVLVVCCVVLGAGYWLYRRKQQAKGR